MTPHTFYLLVIIVLFVCISCITHMPDDAHRMSETLQINTRDVLSRLCDEERKVFRLLESTKKKIINAQLAVIFNQTCIYIYIYIYIYICDGFDSWIWAKVLIFNRKMFNPVNRDSPYWEIICESRVFSRDLLIFKSKFCFTFLAWIGDRFFIHFFHFNLFSYYDYEVIWSLL